VVARHGSETRFGDDQQEMSFLVDHLAELRAFAESVQASIRAGAKILTTGELETIWGINDRLRDALAPFDDGIEEPRIGASPSRSPVGSSSWETRITSAGRATERVGRPRRRSGSAARGARKR
jgi:hypothetical protein